VGSIAQRAENTVTKTRIIQSVRMKRFKNVSRACVRACVRMRNACLRCASVSTAEQILVLISGEVQSKGVFLLLSFSLSLSLSLSLSHENAGLNSKLLPLSHDKRGKTVIGAVEATRAPVRVAYAYSIN